LIESSLSRELLAGIDDESNIKSLSNGRILEKSPIGARNNLLLILDSLTNGEKFVLDVLFVLPNSAQRSTCIIDPVSMLNIPTWGFWEEWKLSKDDDWDQHLEYNDHLPVPISELSRVLATSIVDPVCDEGTNGVEELPERHDRASDFWRCNLTDIDGSSS